MQISPSQSDTLNQADIAGNSAPAPVDIQHLRRYTFGDQALEKEILSLFLAQLPETMASLRAATTERDWKIAAHTLKGSSRAIGASRMARLAQDAEGLSCAGDREACCEAISRLEEAASEARTFINGAYKLD
ncbi:MAG TPA: Hpt domain-containing protein [Hyphomicrobium sp.]|jgi:HPt (histidine-containing phosphotransfer) domain-containing protein